MTMELARPLVVFDLETTGLDRASDRIVEFGSIKLHPDGNRQPFVLRINPERPIPAEATRVHGIRDEDVAESPKFARVAPDLLGFFSGADIGGFNVLDFDIPILAAEMMRAGHAFPPAGTNVVDAKSIFFLKETRTLVDAVRLYCGRPHDDAHGALADAAASADVLVAQLARYSDLPRTIEELAHLCNAPPPGFADRGRKFAWRNGVAVCDFGNKHKGRALQDIAQLDPGYLTWMLGGDFHEHTKFVVREALAGRLPVPGLNT
jgi:DNA polymerase-3 subunit epsilon